MERWSALRARLFNAIFAYNSVANGDLIHQYLGELEQIATKELQAELERCRVLVQEWSDTWYPKFPAS